MTEEQVRKTVSDAVAEALANSQLCKCSLSESQLKTIDEFTDAVKEVGKGNIHAGVQAIRDNNKWVIKFRSAGEKLGTAILITLLGAFTTGIVAAMWAGLKALVARDN